MSKVFGKPGIKAILLIFSCLIFSSADVFSQDLGSSSGIFRVPNPASKNTSSKSTKPTRPKTASVTAKKNKPKQAAKTKTKPVRTATKTTNPREIVSNDQTTVYNPQPQSSIIITVGDKTSGDFDELFEQSVEEGNRARDERNYTRAENAYRRAQNLKSKDSRAVYGLGNIYADQQRWEEAEKAYRQAILLEPDEPGAYIALSYVMTQPIAAENLSDRYSEAEKMARKAVQLDSNNAFAYDQLGVALELRGIISAETQNAYRRAIQLEPDFALAFAHLGRLYRRNGKAVESADAYRKAIQFSSDVPTMILVADVMQSEQKYFDSEQLLRRALAMDAKNPTALNLLGRALTTRGAFDEAETVLKKSAEVSPNSYVSYTLQASLDLRRGRFEDAEKTLNKALTVVSANERKRLAREFEAVGDAFLKAGKAKDAQRLYRQAMALDGSKTILTEKLAKVQ
jgi:superkiller protein 3